MKKIFCFTMAVLILISCLGITAFAKSEGYSWYCVHRKDGKQPRCDASMEFIEKYNGFYIDKNHGDSSNEKVIYLTFDAGYENGNTAKILDIMKAENVTGAFFILSHLINSEPELVRRMADEGHTVCNHTSRHKDMTQITNKDDFKAELDCLEELYLKTTGYRMSKYYRPPEGKFSEENLAIVNDLGYKTIFWSFAYADWDNNNQMSEDAAMNKIMSNIHNGEIMLLHPTSATNAAILGRIIRELKSQGYRFGRLDELER